MPVVQPPRDTAWFPKGHLCRMDTAVRLLLCLLLTGCGVEDRAPAGQDQPPAASDATFEATQTQRALGIPVREFPAPQGPAGFDDLPAGAPAFRFSATEQPPSGPTPRASYQTRRVVRTRAPDGSAYEAYCGYDDPMEIVPGHGFVSTLANRRHRYGTHHRAEYHPLDVFIGKRVGGRLAPLLFFRDVGSHTTAPHHLAFDGRGQCHLTVADVDLYQDNRLHLYWVTGDPAARKWTAAWLIDRRGFTSWSHPWSAAWEEKVHSVWDWCDASSGRAAPGSGLFYVEWTPRGFGRKARVVPGEVRSWDAAVDPRTGRLLVAFSKEDGVYVASRSDGAVWARATRLNPGVTGNCDVAVEATEGGTFVLRTGSENTKEWVLRPE